MEYNFFKITAVYSMNGICSPPKQEIPVVKKSNLVQYHKCPLCPYMTKSDKIFMDHAGQHEIPFSERYFTCSSDSLKEYKCSLCSYSTMLQTFYNAHLERIHGSPSRSFQTELHWPQAYRCRKRKKCRFTTYSQLLYIFHCKECELQKIPSRAVAQMQCVKCPFKTDKTKGFHVHMRKHLKTETLFYCKECPFKAKKKVFVANHCRFKHKDKFKREKKKLKKKKTVGKNRKQRNIRTCDKCPFRCTNETSYLNHIFYKHCTDGDINWLYCDKCPFKSANITRLTTHKKKKHKEEIKKESSDSEKEEQVGEFFTCPLCKFYSWEPEKYCEHVIENHVNKKTVTLYTCELCSFKCFDHDELQNHIYKKHLERIMCEICRGLFKGQEMLKKHVFQSHIL